MSKESQNPEERPKDIEASKWAIKQSIGFTAEEQDAFFEWLAADPEHAEAFSRRRQVWSELDSLAEWRPEHSLKPNPDLLQASSSKDRSNSFGNIILFVTGLAAAVVIGFVSWNVVSKEEVSKSIQLAAGGFALRYERHRLEDGSIVELNRGSQALVEFSKNMRQVTLESGEAHFTITKDPDRPFIVNARGVAVQAIGTIFNVQIKEDSVSVLVTEGRVAVDHRDTETFDQPLDLLGVPTQHLSAGQRSVFDLKTAEPEALVQTVSTVEIEQQLSWLKQVLSFQAAPLSDIVNEFNRRNYTQITIEDPEIRGLELTGAFVPNNVDAFVKVLEVTQGIEGEKVGESVIVLRKKR
ncbi:MAG: FecR domain-containing protein [Verrucomicrobia bacterium]|nr:FecR domain-containing protein [Verrucomicrobiota bacterium]MDA1067328.1 FecR domain-containing protein [Verrucomicrobiota bacterium]